MNHYWKYIDVALALILALFGLPVTGRMTMTFADGGQYQVQYFERALRVSPGEPRAI